MKKIRSSFLYVLWLGFFALALTACSDDSKTAGGSTEDSGIVAITDRVVAGAAQKGPFAKGAAVIVKELDGSTLTPTGRQYSTKVTGDRGEYSLEHVNLSSQYAMVEVSGYYRNEVTGELTAGTLNLEAVVDLSKKDSVNVNVLTHLECQRVLELVKNGSKFGDAKKTAKSEVKAALNIDASLGDFESLDIFGGSEDDGVLMAASILLQSDLSEARLGERLTDLSMDISADGKWDDGEVKEEMASWASQADMDQIYQNVNGWGLTETPVEKSSYVEEFVKENSGDAVASSSSEESDASSSSRGVAVNPSVEYGTLVDERDGTTYRTTTIGTQVWMAENLRYVTEDSHCYDDDEAYCEKYGRYYGYDPNGPELCPSGWHLPTRSEWRTLFDAVGGIEVASKALRAVGAWDVEIYPETADDKDEYGFGASPAGVYGFGDEGGTGFFLSSSNENGEPASETDGGIYDVGFGSVDQAHESTAAFGVAINARCLQD